MFKKILWKRRSKNRLRKMVHPRARVGRGRSRRHQASKQKTQRDKSRLKEVKTGQRRGMCRWR